MMNKVLIVDDEKVTRLTISEFLEESGFSAVEAAGGREALKIFARERPSAVLLDLKMPEMDGDEIMQELKKIDPAVPIIIVTGYGDIPTAVKMIKLGAYDFLIKPIEFERLIFVLKRGMEKYDLEKRVKDLSLSLKTSLYPGQDSEGGGRKKDRSPGQHKTRRDRCEDHRRDEFRHQGSGKKWQNQGRSLFSSQRIRDDAAAFAGAN